MSWGTRPSPPEVPESYRIQAAYGGSGECLLHTGDLAFAVYTGEFRDGRSSTLQHFTFERPRLLGTVPELGSHFITRPAANWTEHVCCIDAVVFAGVVAPAPPSGLEVARPETLARVAGYSLVCPIERQKRHIQLSQYNKSRPVSQWGKGVGRAQCGNPPGAWARGGGGFGRPV
jgi:hypothetical protein